MIGIILRSAIFYLLDMDVFVNYFSTSISLLNKSVSILYYSLITFISFIINSDINFNSIKEIRLSYFFLDNSKYMCMSEGYTNLEKDVKPLKLKTYNSMDREESGSSGSSKKAVAGFNTPDGNIPYDAPIRRLIPSSYIISDIKQLSLELATRHKNNTDLILNHTRTRIAWISEHFSKIPEDIKDNNALELRKAIQKDLDDAKAYLAENEARQALYISRLEFIARNSNNSNNPS